MLPAQAMGAMLMAKLKPKLKTKLKKAPVNPDSKDSGTRKDPTCKRCGRRKVTDAIAMEKHGNRVSKDSVAYCRVNEEMYLPGYPKQG